MSTEHGRYQYSANCAAEIDWCLNGALLRYAKLTPRERAISRGKAADAIAYADGPKALVDTLLLSAADVDHTVKCKGAHFVGWMRRAASRLYGVRRDIPHHVEAVWLHYDRAYQVIFDGNARLEIEEVRSWCEGGEPYTRKVTQDPFSQTGVGDP